MQPQKMVPASTVVKSDSKILSSKSVTQSYNGAQGQVFTKLIYILQS